MRVFVTGGSGFVGGHVIEALAQRHEVLAMARSERSAAVVAGFGARPVSADLDTVAAHHLDGVDAVVHVAAAVEEWAPAEHYERANVRGTARILEAAKGAGARRFVHVSSNAVVFDRKGQRGVDESAPVPDHRGFPYGDTKARAEALVRAADAPGFTTIAVRPCLVWGPRDATLLPALRRLVDDGRFVWLDRGEAVFSTTHVFNLVEGIRAALTRGEGGAAYFLADDPDVTVREFFEGFARANGLTLPGRSIPGWVARSAARGLELGWGWTGASGLPPVTTMAASLLSRDMTVRTDRARAELGWAPVIDRAAAIAQLAA